MAQKREIVMSKVLKGKRGVTKNKLALYIILVVLCSSLILAQSGEDSPYGMNGICRAWMNKPIDNQTVKLAQAAGVKWSRVVANWPRIEPEDDQYNFNSLNHKLILLNEHDITPYVMLVHAGTCPDWITSAPDGEGPKGYPPRNDGNWKSWRDLVGQLVGRYGCGQGGMCIVTHWEIWSEPEGIYWREKGHNAQEYVSFLQVTHDTIKAIDPNAKIILARFKGYAVQRVNTQNFNNQPDAETRFIVGVFNNGAGDYFDVFSMGGPYACDWQEGSYSSLQPRYSNARAIMNHYGLGEKPIWITEAGCGSDSVEEGVSDPVGETNQATDLRNLYERSINIGYSKIFWTHLEEVPGGSYGLAHGFDGIVRRNTLEPKPAYYSYQEMTGNTPSTSCTDYTCSASDGINWTDKCTSEDMACCNEVSCVDPRIEKCYPNSAGAVIEGYPHWWSGNDKIAYCLPTSKWVDCDVGQWRCDSADNCGGVIGDCPNDNCWIKAGEDNLGEYNDQNIAQCCGDDIGEKYSGGTDGTYACCDGKDADGNNLDGEECVLNGKCQDRKVGVEVCGNNIDEDCDGQDLDCGQQKQGDVNGDNIVDVEDLAIIAQNFGITGSNLENDLNNDDKIDIFDLVIVAKNFGI